jgi:dolichyl-phosphate beta-glucosyltransferase
LSVRLSVVIPCYNEVRRIGATLESFQKYLHRQVYAHEVIVVDDGSTDGTADHVRSRFPEVRVIRYEENRGKGYATKAGMLEATGEIRLVSDADGSTPIAEVEKFWPHFDRGGAVVIGSRALPDSDVAVRQPWYRQNMGRVYNVMLRMLGLTNFPDTQCGFKAFTAAACEIVFPRQRMDGFGADAECLYIAQRHGLAIAQVAVRWLNSPDSRVNALTDSLRMIGEALTIRVNTFLRVYD